MRNSVATNSALLLLLNTIKNSNRIINNNNNNNNQYHHFSPSHRFLFAKKMTTQVATSMEKKGVGYNTEKDDHEENIREGFCKEACDYKGIADRLIPHLLNIYGSHATPKDFEIYAPNATFEDPLMCAHGIKQIKSAFYSLPKVFGESRIVEYTVNENVISPSQQEILIDNKQHYKFLGKDIDMISLIKLQVEDGKIVRHEDRWDKKPLLTKETVSFPLVGRIMETTRRGSMLVTHALMRFGKDPTDVK